MSKRAEIRARRDQRRRQQTLITIIVIIGAALVITALLIWPSIKPIGDIVQPTTFAYPNTSGMAMGDPKAPVRIDEFSDFQCPYCKLFHDETLQQLAQTYVATGKVYFVFHNFPIVDSQSVAKESHDAARAAVCAAQQDKFWAYHDVLFANQTAENIGDFSVRRLEAMASGLGLDSSKFSACLSDPQTSSKVDQDYALGLQDNVESTPSFMINGKLVTGAQAFSTFQAQIEADLAAAK
jgi:protein-disulfide isomerase